MDCENCELRLIMKIFLKNWSIETGFQISSKDTPATNGSKGPIMIENSTTDYGRLSDASSDVVGRCMFLIWS